jgi:hypothetical protein
MKQMTWVVVIAVLGGLGYWVWLASKRYGERKRAAEERFSAFMAQTMKPPAPKSDAAAGAVAAAAPAAPVPLAPVAPAKPGASDLVQQKLLFEAAAKAADAGEPALSIQLYARLIARYPTGAFVTQARAAVDAQKARLARH